MKKIIPFLFLAFPAFAEQPCEMTERAMAYELSLMGQQQTVEDYVKTARIYDQMARRGCKENKQMYQGYAKASIAAARGLNGVYNYDNQRPYYANPTYSHYDNMINNANPKTY